MDIITFRKSPLFRYIALTVLIAFTSFFPVQPGYTQGAIIMPPPGQMIHFTDHFEPPQMVGLKVNFKNPFSFDFIMDQGQNPMSDDIKKEEFNKIIKYFLVSLTMPNKDMWVNLSPYESKHIIPEVFAQTEMGRDLLAQDYILKQFTASLMYPEEGLGRKFWDKVYQEAQLRFGTTEINVNTFNKVWIVADHADVYQKDDTAFLVASHLKVMLEQDYMAIEKNKEMFGNVPAANAIGDAKTQMASQLVREIIIPAIEKEVNEGQNFAAVRQVYNAEIMATWFKKTLRESLLGQVFANKSKIAGQRVSDPQAAENIYKQYLRAYKIGVYNYIRKDATPDGQLIPRKYFSGGVLVVPEAGVRAYNNLKQPSELPTPREVESLTTQLSEDFRTKVADILAQQGDRDTQINPREAKQLTEIAQQLPERSPEESALKADILTSLSQEPVGPKVEKFQKTELANQARLDDAMVSFIPSAQRQAPAPAEISVKLVGSSVGNTINALSDLKGALQGYTGAERAVVERTIPEIEKITTALQGINSGLSEASNGPTEALAPYVIDRVMPEINSNNDAIQRQLNTLASIPELKETLSRVSGSLESTAKRLNLAARGLTQGNNTIPAEMSANLVGSSVGNTINTLSDLKGALQGYTGAERAVVERTIPEIEKITTALQGINSGLSEASNGPTEALAPYVSRVMPEINSNNDAIKGQLNTLANIPELKGTLSRVSGSLENTAKRLNLAARGLTQGNNTIPAEMSANLVGSSVGNTINTLSDLKGALQGYTGAERAVVERTIPEIEKITTALQGINSGLSEASNGPTEALAPYVSRVMPEINSNNDAIKGQLNTLANIPELKETLSRVSGSLENTAKRLNLAARGLTQGNNTIPAEMSANLVGSSVGNTINTLSDLKGALQGYTGAERAVVERTIPEIEKITTALQGINSGLSEASNGPTEALAPYVSRVMPEINSNNDAIKGQLNTLANIPELKETLSRVSGSLDSITSSLAIAQGALVATPLNVPAPAPVVEPGELLAGALLETVANNSGVGANTIDNTLMGLAGGSEGLDADQLSRLKDQVRDIRERLEEVKADQSKRKAALEYVAQQLKEPLFNQQGSLRTELTPIRQSIAKQLQEGLRLPDK